MKSLKKVMALTLSAAMAFSMSTSVFADAPTTTAGTGAIYSFNIESVIVPTAITFATNPQGLTVKVNGQAQTGQVLSLGYGIINRSTKDKDVEISFAATVPEGVNLVNDKSKVVNPASTDKDLSVMLQIAAAAEAPTKVLNSTNVETAIDKDTAAAALANTKIQAATNGVRTLASTGATKMKFKLAKATYAAKSSGGDVVLGTDNDNDVKEKFELSANGGVTGFIITGAMNDQADWSSLPSGAKITIAPTYEVTEPDGYEVNQAIANTASQVGLGATLTAPTASNASIVTSWTGARVGAESYLTFSSIKVTAKKDGVYETFEIKDYVNYGLENYNTTGAFTCTIKAENVSYFDASSPYHIVFTASDGTVVVLSTTVPATS